MAKKKVAVTKRPAKAVKVAASTKTKRKPRFNKVYTHDKQPFGIRIGFICEIDNTFSWVVTDDKGIRISMSTQWFYHKAAAVKNMGEEAKGVVGLYYADPSEVFTLP